MAKLFNYLFTSANLSDGVTNAEELKTIAEMPFLRAFFTASIDCTSGAKNRRKWANKAAKTKGTETDTGSQNGSNRKRTDEHKQ